MTRSLNLDPKFNPSSYPPLEFELPILPGGELHPKLNKKIISSKIDKVIITQRANNSDAIMAILFAADALRRIGITRLALVMPYIPYARQDRYDIVDNYGESFTLKVFADLINSVGFEKVWVLDAHSDVSKGLINNCINIDNFEYVDYMLNDIFQGEEDKRFNLISIDSGASKKINKLATYLYKHGWKFDIIQCDKKRDIATGEITGFKAYVDPEGLYLLPSIVVDDICDGGASFLHLASELNKHNSGKKYLFVSHGIFSKGFEVLENEYKGIYTTDSIKFIHSIYVTQFEFKI